MLTKIKTFPIKLTESDHEKLSETAKKAGMTLEHFILTAITEKVQKQETAVRK